MRSITMGMCSLKEKGKKEVFPDVILIHILSEIYDEI